MPHKDRDVARAQARATSNRRREAQRAIINAAKSRPCMDCGGTYPPVCMDFDHRPGVKKLWCVGKAVWTNEPLDKILAEIDKCDLVCANCHRIRTLSRRKENGR